MIDRSLAIGLAVMLEVVSASPVLGTEQAESRPQAVGADVSQPSILFLAVEDVTRPHVRLITDAFQDVVLAAPDAPALYFESLDASRFEDVDYLEGLRDWLRRKYVGRRIDLVVTLGEDALGFLARKHGEPWPDARVLYLEVGSVNVDVSRDLPQATGMLLEDHFPAALGVIKTILPETSHVGLIYGASAVERTRLGGFADKVRSADLGLEPIVLAGISMEETLAQMTRLPKQTVAIILAPNVDAKGHVLAPTRTCELISAAADVPSFTLGAHDLGCGVVGGLMRDWPVVGRLLANQALARLKGGSSDVVSVPIQQYTTLAFDERQLARWDIPERMLPAGSMVRFRGPNVWRDHRPLMFGVLAVTLVQSLLIVGLVLERKRRRRAEVESRRNLAAMAHLDRRAAMGELATSLAHELNQPLNAILQNAGVAHMMLTSHTLPQALGEMVDIIGDIRKDDIRASELIRRMRGLLQKHEFKAHPVDLNDVAQETVAIVRPDANSRDVQVEMQLAADVAPVLGDRIHLQQVLLNLLLNGVDAVDKSPSARRRVLVRTTQTDADVRLSVVDTGVGIPAEDVSQIFEPFYTTKGDGSGMGMGLAIARSIVDAHGGRMAAENNAEGGATVWFSVPMTHNAEP